MRSFNRRRGILHQRRQSLPRGHRRNVGPPSPLGFESLNPRNRHRCPAAGSLCCSRAAPSSPTSSLPTSDNLLASSDLNLVDPNPPLNVGDLEFNPDDVNNLFTIGDGPTVEADLSAFNPDDSSQVSFGLSGSSLLSDEGPTVASLNDGSDQGNLFASAAGDTSSLDIFS